MAVDLAGDVTFQAADDLLLGQALLAAPLDVPRIKKDFPILERLVHGKRLVYLDTASSAQKPLAVIEAMSRYYETTHANVHRGVYEIAQEATRLY